MLDKNIAGLFAAKVCCSLKESSFVRLILVALEQELLR